MCSLATQFLCQEEPEGGGGGALECQGKAIFTDHARCDFHVVYRNRNSPRWVWVIHIGTRVLPAASVGSRGPPELRLPLLGEVVDRSVTTLAVTD